MCAPDHIICIKIVQHRLTNIIWYGFVWLTYSTFQGVCSLVFYHDNTGFMPVGPWPTTRLRFEFVDPRPTNHSVIDNAAF